MEMRWKNKIDCEKKVLIDTPKQMLFPTTTNYINGRVVRTGKLFSHVFVVKKGDVQLS